MLFLFLYVSATVIDYFFTNTFIDAFIDNHISSLTLLIRVPEAFPLPPLPQPVNDRRLTALFNFTGPVQLN